MKVVAFLQNMWVRDPERVRRMIEGDRTGQYRLRIIAYALFAGCLTGRRLQSGLGKVWCEEIFWEEASPVIAGDPDECPPPDAYHIAKVFEAFKPDVVVCFSAPAREIIRERCVATGALFIACSHPACRTATIVREIAEVRRQLDDEAGARRVWKQEFLGEPTVTANER